MQFSSDEMRYARKSNLYDYLIKYHSNYFKTEGQSIHPKDNNSLSIKKGYSGYIDFATGDKGNSVDFLVKYMGYSTTEAVKSLCENSNIFIPAYEKKEILNPIIDISNKKIDFPEPVEGQCKQLFAYLMNRCISADIIQMLINEKILYQEKEHNNIVFINKEKDFAELHGSLSFGKPFHRCIKSCPDRFWWFRSSSKAEVAYICEAAIDAISLYLIHKKNGNTVPAYYISIAGVANQKTIDRIKKQEFLKKIIIAVDNDKAGQQCRERNCDLEYIIPNSKDWNEDLQKGI